MAFNDPFNGNNVPNDGDTSSNFYEDPAAEFLEREKLELGDITGNGDANSSEEPYNSLTNGIDHHSFILIT
jgi:hypothetical protein